MRYIWSNLNTTQSLWRAIRPSRTGSIRHRPPLSNPLFWSGGVQRLISTQYHSQFTSAHITTSNVDTPQKTSSPQPQLSAAHLSRAACNAIHLSLQNPTGGLEDAYLIVNSLRVSAIRNDPTRFNKLEGDFAGSTIDFGREVSPRLSSHALLHGLLRIGLTERASGLAKMMMETGIRLRSKTLEAVFHAALPPPMNQPPRPTIPAQPFNITSYQSRIGDLSSVTQHEGTRTALQLLDAAKKTHHGSTRGMFGTLLAICLINGEIILASLLFGFFVKDRQLKTSLAVRLHEAKSMESHAPPAKDQCDGPPGVISTSTWLDKILSPINNILSRDGYGEEFRLSVASALQSLAYLTVLFEHRQLLISNISPLVHSLYNCPRVMDEVWIVKKDGHLSQTKAYPYFHSVLRRLIWTLGKDKWGQMPFKSNLASLNSLLHYALRHRLDPASAGMILQYMKEQNVQPDTVTYNILLRSGTTLRQDSIVQEALEGLHLEFGSNDSHLLERPSNSNDIEEAHEFDTDRSSPHVESYGHLPQDCTKPPLTPKSLLESDSYTINSYLTYLKAAQPQRVVDVLLEFFPELCYAYKAQLAALGPAERAAMQVRTREASIKRAIKLGPHVLTTFLAGLLNARKTGLMKWVWHLARQAERRSWDPCYLPGASAWFIPIHAYTIILERLLVEHKNPSMIPVGSQKAWSLQQSRSRLLRAGLRLYRVVKSRARRAQIASRSGTIVRKGTLLRPDSRFLNAILRLFAYRGRRQRNTAHYRNTFRRAQLRHAHLGIVSPHWTPLLQEVGEDIVRAGHAIPIGLRHIFIGRWDEGTWNMKRPEIDRRPSAFPKGDLPPSTPSPFSVPVYRRKTMLHHHRNL